MSTNRLNTSAPSDKSETKVSQPYLRREIGRGIGLFSQGLHDFNVPQRRAIGRISLWKTSGSDELTSPYWVGEQRITVLSNAADRYRGDGICSFVDTVEGLDGCKEPGYFTRSVVLVEDRHAVPVKQLAVQEHASSATRPYQLAFDAYEDDGEGKLNPSYFVAPFDPNTSKEAFQAAWDSLRVKSGIEDRCKGNAPACVPSIQDWTTAGLGSSLLETSGEQDRRALEQLIQAVDNFDFSEGFSEYLPEGRELSTRTGTSVTKL